MGRSKKAKWLSDIEEFSFQWLFWEDWTTQYSHQLYEPAWPQGWALTFRTPWVDDKKHVPDIWAPDSWGSGGHDCPPSCFYDWCPAPPQDTSKDLSTYEVRVVDGSGNNLQNPDWGEAGNQFIRLTPAKYDYSDGEETPVEPRANYRALSNDVIKQGPDVAPNSAGLSDLFTFFGQFIDHDIDIALEGSEEGPHIVGPMDDDNPNFRGVELGIERSTHIDGTGTGASNPSQHANAITSFIDASNVYGSDDATLASLKDPNKPWLLATNDMDEDLLPTEPGPRGQFLAGDIRAGENSALTSIHTIWALEHNRLANELKDKHPAWTDDEVFNAAKITVEALMQHIVFKEWLPLLVGAENIPEYQGYDETVDPTISHEFASAAFRLGHSLLSSQIKRLDENENSNGTSDDDLMLAQMFFNAAILKQAGSVDTLVRGLASQTAQELDQHLVEDVRSLLFPGPDGIQVRDLSVLNNLRGLDHGIGTLNEVREALGLQKYSSFFDLTGDQALADALAEHYASVDDVDLWIGGLIEEHVEGSQLGETFQYIVLDQFMRLRDGDRFYYEERLEDHPELLNLVEETSFSDIIKRTTDIKYLQDDVFIAHDRIVGDDGKNKLVGDDGHDLIIAYAGRDHIRGKDGDDDIYAGKGHDKVWGGKGNDVIYGEEGNDHLHGGRGDDLFVFEKGSGRDKIKDFKVRDDKIDLSDYGFESLWEVKAASHWTRDGVVINLDYETGASVKLVGVKLHQLSDDNFIYDQSDDQLIA